MRKRVLFATLAAAALLVAPVAGVDAKPDGVGKSKKCDKPKVGFKVNGTFDGYDGTLLSLDVVRANRHARDWLDDGNDPSFDTSDVETSKFIGVTDRSTDGVGFEDVVEGDRVKIKAKLALPERGCETTELEGDTDPEVKKIKVKRPAAEID
jgi:hypothetical protein